MKKNHVLIFSGHMIDERDRAEKRFPAEIEEKVKDAIKVAIIDKENDNNFDFYGLAGGACGGDIIFHEVCLELNISSKILLALPPEDFIKESVSFAGDSWVKRFRYLIKNLPVEVFKMNKLKNINYKSHYSIWELSNCWILDYASKFEDSKLSLIAVWDEVITDKQKPGGTHQMVMEARKQKIEVSIINPIHL